MEESNKSETMKNSKSLYSKKGNKKRTTTLVFAIVFFSSFFGALFGFMAGSISDSITPFFENRDNQSEIVQKGRKVVVQEESAVIDVVDKATPAVVSIVITKDVPKIKNFFDNQDPFDSFFFSPFMQQDEETEQREVGGGSGFLVSSDGYIVTNKHVVNDSDAEYTVLTNNGKEHNARVLALHPTMDIAIMKIEGTDFPALELGDSENLKVGQSVVAIGNSLGEFSNSVSLGIVSGLQRNVTAGSATGSVERLSNIIQTDAAINPGNSGGPLLDITGKVIGVNVAVAQGAENVGFALPVDQVRETVSQVKEKGRISVPFLGVRYIVLDEDIQKENDLPFDYGALVLRGESRTDFAVIPGSPADKAGITENNIILEIDGKRITDENQLGDAISGHKVGDTITMKVWQKGETKEVQVTLEERKN